MAEPAPGDSSTDHARNPGEAARREVGERPGAGAPTPMSYLTGMGDVASTAQAILNVTSDPHLPEVVCHTMRLASFERGEKPGLVCNKIPVTASPGLGIGLRYAVVPLRAADKMREHPVLAIAGAVGLVAALFALGFSAGRATVGRSAA